MNKDQETKFSYAKEWAFIFGIAGYILSAFSWKFLIIGGVAGALLGYFRGNYPDYGMGVRNRINTKLGIAGIIVSVLVITTTWGLGERISQLTDEPFLAEVIIQIILATLLTSILSLIIPSLKIHGVLNKIINFSFLFICILAFIGLLYTIFVFYGFSQMRFIS